MSKGNPLLSISSRQKIHEVFDILVAKQPSAPALITDDYVCSYAELNDAAETLARALLGRGIESGEAVGILTERSAGLPGAFLAILKAGGVYVPMVADLPGDRLANMAQQANIRRLIVLDGIAPPAPLIDALIGNGALGASDATLRPERLPADQPDRVFPPTAQDMSALAAILFTSGSTGTPKGVMIRHDSCTNMALGHVAAHGIDQEDRILLSTSPGFILGFRELCLPFMSGAAFVPVTRAMIDAPDRLLAHMARHRVSIAMFTPSYLRLLNGAVPQGLRCIVTAGERPNIDDARHYARHLDYWNVHGATEVCGTICMHHVDPADPGPIPSGLPFANTAVYLLDESGNEVPRGEVGEIHIVGTGVSPGYLNQPQLTAKSFVETRYGRAFRTRDLGRLNSDGRLETIGRADDVVKISGQSVSLGEIERTLMRHPRVRRAVAMQVKGRLMAVVESPDDPAAAESVDWREFLGKTLASHMIPARVAVLPKMPISSAGKVDRRGLLGLADAFFERAREAEGAMAPQNALERTIAGIWEEVIGVRPIGRSDNFFYVGGTSLMAIAVSQRLQAAGHQVPVQMVLATLTIAALAERIAAADSQTLDGDAPLSKEKATADQEGFWLAAELGLPPAASHIVRVLGVHGRIPPPQSWHAAWIRLIEHHPALRTAFCKNGDGSLGWRTFAPDELLLSSHFSQDRCQSLAAGREIAARRANERFRLDTPPLVRAGLIEVEEGNETLFWCVLHHSVVDGISARLILDHLLASLAGRKLPPTANGIGVAGRTEQRYLASPQAAQDREFWRSRLDALVARNEEAFHEYATDRPRPSLPGGTGAPPLIERLDASTVAALGELAKAHGAGLHALLLAILAAEVQRRDGRRAVILGSGVSLRPAGCENAVGHFVNLLPVLVIQEREEPFSALLRLVQSALTETVEHGSYPAPLLSREFRQRHAELRRHSPALFDMALTAIPSRTFIDTELGLGLQPRPLPGELEYPAAGLDLLFSHEPCPDGGLNLLLTFSADVYTRATAEAWLSSLAAWARLLAEEPERSGKPLPALLPHEKAILERWERGPDRPLPERCCHEVFEALAEQYPDRPAIIGREYSITFGQLEAQANRIAQRLRQQAVARGAAVAVLTAEPAELPVAVLGIWKAGGAYLPLPFELPAARLASMVKDAGACHLIVPGSLPVPEPLMHPALRVIRPEECPPCHERPRAAGSADDIAYIIYTSGTTGQPKGIPITHRGYLDTIQGVAETIGLTPDDRLALVSTAGFDASLWELGHGLLSGLPLVPVSPALRDDPWQLKRFYREMGVTVAFHVPSYLRVSEKEPFTGLRILLTGGEAPSHRDLVHLPDGVALWNFYGPSEAAIVVSGGQIPKDHAPDVPLPVGHPLPNVRITLRGRDGAPVPPGVRGELWLSGSGVTGGYLNRPELNEERFVVTPEGRFYRSGDYGRWTPDGRIEFQGRIDDQVKLHGQRVELNEIEQVLLASGAAADAVVLVDSAAGGAKVLRAFVRLAENARTDLDAFLLEHLPTHMLPASITPVSAIPLTPVGKVDRQALLACARRQLETLAHEPPQNQLEVEVAAIWADVLGLSAGRNANFFALGGNSLLAVSLAHRVSQRTGRQVPARLLFIAPTLAAFVKKIALLPAAAADAAADTDLATAGEQEFWTAETAGLDTRTFTIPVHYRVAPGTIEPERWRQAWATLVLRHEGLRTFFAEDETGRLCRLVADEVAGELELTAAPDQGAALRLIRQRQAQPLLMQRPPLWRLGLIRVEKDGSHLFWLALHHAIGDGQSVGTLVDELAVLLAGGELPPAAGTGGLFAAREQAYCSTADYREDGEYWRTLLENLPGEAMAEWPVDYPRSAQTPPGNHRLKICLDARTSEGLKSLARSQEAGMHAIMLALLALEASRRTGRLDLLIGTTASLRESAADAGIVGYGVNMLPLHLRTGARQSFGDLLRATQASLAEALQHVRYPFSRIYRDFWDARPGVRDPQRYPLFDLAVTENPGRQGSDGRFFASAATPAAENGLTEYERTAASPGQDMVLIHELRQEGLLLQLHVNAALYAEETARNWLAALAGWARWLADDRSRAQHPLPLLLPEEEARLDQWERGDHVPRPPLRFHELFEERVDQPGQADRPAVITRERIVSYRALEEDANVIAHALVRAGVKPGDAVAVLSSRSPSLPAAVLGIWKAGAVYLPLAAELPPERLSFMARDAGISRLIALDGVAVPEALAAVLAEMPEPLRPEALPDLFRRENRQRSGIAGTEGDAAYILFTSGSTGEPKGTMISHASYVNLVLGVGETLGLAPDDRCLMFASPSFDVSLSDIGVPLACGAAICPASDTVIESPGRFLALLEELRITAIDITPTYLRLLAGADLPSSLRILVTGGEPPVPADVQAHAPRLRYYNAYGPTENTITSTMGLLQESEGTPAAGRPLPNTSIHIGDAQGNRLPPGAVGEIWLGGIGLSAGYLNRPELTAKHFLMTPAGRRYRTGDIGRWRMDGTIEIVGRMDDQVKLNGIRIELGEIEHALAGHPAISQAVALLAGREEGAKSLRAAARLNPGASMPGEEELRAYLRERLPSHMIPSGIVQVAEIPVSASGKVDRPALLAMLADRPAGPGLTPPRDDLERSVAEVWAAVLGLEGIHREDNFFALGGHSLLAIAVAHRLEKMQGRAVPARLLFIAPVLADFADSLRESQAIPPENPADQPPSDRATVGQREFWTAEQSGQDTAGFNIPLTLAASATVVGEERWQAAWTALIERHDALRCGFYEDRAGILRRATVDHLPSVLEIRTAERSDEALAHIKTRQGQAFAMATPGLWRAGLVHDLEGGRTLFWLALHHAVGDGISLGILVEELAALLRGESLPPLPQGGFSRTAATEESYLRSDTARADGAYWQQTIDGLIEKTPEALDEWPLDTPRAKARTVGSVKGSHCFRSHLDAAAADSLRALARRHGSSLHALLLTLVGFEVRRRTGRKGFLLGTAASTRHSADEARTIGYYVNMLPLPCRAGETAPFDDAVQAMQERLAEALQHSRYPFSAIYGDYRRRHPQPTHPARYPLFDIAVTENPGATAGGSEDALLHPLGIAMPGEGDILYELRHNGPAQDLVLVHEGQADGSLVLTWYANAAIYTGDTARFWFCSLIGWMRYLAQRLPEDRLSLPRLLPEEERLLDDWQHGPNRPLPAASFPELFRRRAEMHPQRPALVSALVVQSYAAVDSRTDAMAQALMGLGVERGEVVAVFTGRSAALPATVLAIWKAGACYLPLTADLPGERLAFMARDAECRLLLVLDGLQLPPELDKGEYTVVRPEELTATTSPPIQQSLTPDDLAYVIYTSGSTGAPKGVMLRHGGMLNLALGGAEILGMQADDRALLMASPSFDLWISDLVIAWSAGAALVPVGREEMDDIPGMQALFRRRGVTVATMSPSYLRLFEQADFPGLRLLMTVGEPPNADDMHHYADRLTCFNGYGPTENTAAATFSQIQAEAEQITAGRPLANTAVYVVDHAGNPVPPGVVGEIQLGGIGLAAGYLKRPDLTAEKFVMTAAGERRYWTGDLGRWSLSGELRLVGRSDSQVKLRGQRVELGEIEQRLASHPGVRQAAAIVASSADERQKLLAFVTLDPEAETPTQAAWSKFAAERLPSYMIPSTVFRLDGFPLTAAGKIDRRALLASVAQSEAVVPAGAEETWRTPVEKRIAEIWAAQLGCPSVQRCDNFFELGGDSLRAIAVIGRLRREFACRVNDLYENPVLADFARICQPHPDLLRTRIAEVSAGYAQAQTAQAGPDTALQGERAAYESRTIDYLARDLKARRSYRHVLLTGATGYLGSYILRELLADPALRVTAVVRGSDDKSSRLRLIRVLTGYFGAAAGNALGDNDRLRVLAGDLRQEQLLVSSDDYRELATTVDAVYHCAANVNHVGHYRDFDDANVTATRNLLALAAQCQPMTADFHFISTLSVVGDGSPGDSGLFSEFDPPPEASDDNYYIRTKQEAERLVLGARHRLANACIYRVGNIGFATDSTCLQRNLAANAFFRQIVAFLRLGAVPVELPAALCHVDVVARSVVSLATTMALTNAIHHIETARRDRLADLIQASEAAQGIKACNFGAFLALLRQAVDQPAMEAAVAETVETLRLLSGPSPARRRRPVVVSDRTQRLLQKLGIVWPAIPPAGRDALLQAAMSELRHV